METKVVARRLLYAAQWVSVGCLLGLILWICLRFGRYSAASTTEPWTWLRLNTVPGAGSRFDIVCYSNGTIIFHGMHRTAHLGQKRLQLETEELLALQKFMDSHTFTSDPTARVISYRLQLSSHIDDAYFYGHASTTFNSLISLMHVDGLLSYKHWTNLLRMSQMAIKRPARPSMDDVRARMKRSAPFLDSRSYIVPTLDNSYMIAMHSRLPIYVSATIPNGGLVPIESPEELCLSSQVTTFGFDLADVCLSIDELLIVNQFYPLRGQFSWLKTHKDRSSESEELDGEFQRRDVRHGETSHPHT